METRSTLTFAVGAVVFSVLFLQFSGEVSGAPFLLGNQMSALSVIPKTEEQATALLNFLKDNPQYGVNSSRTIQVNTVELILVPAEDAVKVQSGLEERGLRLGESNMNNNNNNAYQISEGE